MNQESYSLSRDTEVLVKALLLALTEEENLQAMTALKESLIKPIKIGKTLDMILETQVMTRAEITHFTVEVEKEGQEAVAITEEIEDKEAVAIVETIGNAAMTETEEEEVMTETEEVIDQEAMKEHVAMIIIEEEEMIEEIVVTKEGVIAEIATLEETELEANLETISLILIRMIDVAVSLLRTETAAPQTAI
mgnify:CR=1 FL=1